jgi:nitroreductase
VDTFLAITSRRDERRYAPGPLPDDVVGRILDAGRLAGSSRNRQPWTFHVLTREAVTRLSAAVSVPDNVLHAGFVVAISVTGSGRAMFDAGRAAQNMLLAAWNDGVAACPNGVVDDAAAREALELRADEDQIAIVLSFGIPEKPRDVGSRSAAEWSARANRRPLDDVVRQVGS